MRNQTCIKLNAKNIDRYYLFQASYSSYQLNKSRNIWLNIEINFFRWRIKVRVLLNLKAIQSFPLVSTSKGFLPWTYFFPLNWSFYIDLGSVCDATVLKLNFFPPPFLVSHPNILYTLLSDSFSISIIEPLSHNGSNP